MNLLPKTEAQAIAEQIDNAQVELVRHIESQLCNFHSRINTEGKQQAILDALGTNAAQAVAKYVAMRDAVLAINPAANIPAPDPSVFTVNPDGTVTYIAPPATEIDGPNP